MDRVKGLHINQETLIGHLISLINVHFVSELRRQKQTIDQLDRSARVTTKNAELFKLADTERDLVYLQHTLEDQRRVLARLWKDARFSRALTDPDLKQHIQLNQRYAEKLIAIYRDLVDSTGSLFTDMMNNNLNHLMQYLNSASLVISVPALIAGIWGMNTGGLPGRNAAFGFWIVVGATVLITVASAAYLARKDYSK